MDWAADEDIFRWMVHNGQKGFGVRGLLLASIEMETFLSGVIKGLPFKG